MPLVKAYVSFKSKIPELTLLRYCKEIVPAGLNSTEGPLTPGSIIFIYQPVDYGIETDAVIEIEAYDFEDRSVDREERANSIREALKKLMPDKKFAIWIRLTKAGYSSDVSDSDSKDDMSMEAAIKRCQS